jgi:hypothetical protein
MSDFQEIGKLLGELVTIKNEKYGDSFKDSASFLELLYPDGIQPDQYMDMLALVRMFDKIKRIATDKDALGESPFSDLAGYSILGIKNSKGALDKLREYVKEIQSDKKEFEEKDFICKKCGINMQNAGSSLCNNGPSHTFVCGDLERL